MAGQRGQRVAAAGYQLKKREVPLPGLMPFPAVGLAAVCYVGMFLNYTRWPTNLGLLVMFTLSVGTFMFWNCANPDHKLHKVADMVFLIGMSNLLMLLYSLGVFDVKPPGQLAYILIIVLSCALGLAETWFIKEHDGLLDGVLHSLFSFVAMGWLVLSFVSMCVAMAKFRRGHVVSIVIYSWIWPLDGAFLLGQTCYRGLTEEF